MTEQQYQSKLIKEYEGKGYYVLKLIKTNKNGIPDLLCLKAGEVPIFVEVKKEGGKPSPLQEFRIKELKELGFNAFISYEKKSRS
tara:strand:+ start:180 stop:434 length:255 start_codon:yes stop_codon:yes gene_type:complete